MNWQKLTFDIESIQSFETRLKPTNQISNCNPSSSPSLRITGTDISLNRQRISTNLIQN